MLIIDAALDGNYARSYVAGLDAELAAPRPRAGRPLLPSRRGSVPPADQRQQQDQLLIDTLSPRAVLRFGEPYLTGHELDDSGGGWRDGLAAHVAAQLGHLAGRGHTRIALALPDRDTPLRAVRQRFADQAAAALGLPPLPPVTLPGSRSHSQPSDRTDPADPATPCANFSPGTRG